MRLGRRPASPAPAGLCKPRALCWPAESGLAPGSSAGGRAAFNRQTGAGAQTKKDNRIIACALFVQDSFPPPTILVTKDVNVALKARAVGLEAQDYLNDKVPTPDEDEGYGRVAVSVYELQRFASEGHFEASEEQQHLLALNDYVLLETPEGKTMPARYHGAGILRRLRIPDSVHAPGGIAIRPRNLEQQFLMDALLDDSVSLVTCYGKAGTGKTLLSTACALHQMRDELNRYDGVSISRPVFSLGKDIGFLPGSLEEKMKPWLQPNYTNRPKDLDLGAVAPVARPLRGRVGTRARRSRATWTGLFRE